MNRREFINDAAIAASSALLLGATVAQAAGQPGAQGEKQANPAPAGLPKPGSTNREITVAGLQTI